MRNINQETREPGTPDFSEISDRELVALLKEGDNKAWEYIYKHVVHPVAYSNKFESLVNSLNLDGYELLSQLYVQMIHKGVIDTFRYESKLITWMKVFYIEKYLLRYAKKKSFVESDDGIENASVDRTSAKEAAEILQLSFAELWRKNPMRAYVYFLKTQDYSSTEIKDRLGLASSNYVDQCHSRAKADLQEFVTKFTGERK